MRFLMIIVAMLVSPIIAAPFDSARIYYLTQNLDRTREKQFRKDIGSTIKILETVIDALLMPGVEKSSAVTGLVSAIPTVELFGRNIANAHFQPLLTALKGGSAMTQSSTLADGAGLKRIERIEEYADTPKNILIEFSGVPSDSLYSTTSSHGKNAGNLITFYPKAFETSWDLVERETEYLFGFPLPLNLILEAQMTSLVPLKDYCKDLSKSGEVPQQVDTPQTRKLKGEREAWSVQDLMGLGTHKKHNAQNYAVLAFLATVKPEIFKDDIYKSPTPSPRNTPSPPGH